MSKFVNVFLVLLAITALVLGFLLLQKLNENATPAPEPIVRAEGNEGSTGSEISALYPPDADASNAVVGEYIAHVARRAVESDEVSIGAACTIAPTVLKTVAGADVVVVNNDTVPHNLTFSGNMQMTLASGERQILPPEWFMNGPGVYGYRCDGDRVSGVIFVAE